LLQKLPSLAGGVVTSLPLQPEGGVVIEFKSKFDGRWYQVRGTFGLFPLEAGRKMAELQEKHPTVEYRLH
jgi:hypothetical protein